MGASQEDDGEMIPQPVLLSVFLVGDIRDPWPVYLLWPYYAEVVYVACRVIGILWS